MGNDRSRSFLRPLACAAAFIPLFCILICFAGSASGEVIFKWGFKERVRQTYLVNPFDLRDETADDMNFLRVRSQLWFSVKPRQGWELFVGLNNEHRHWFKPNDRDFEIDEFIIENLYVKVTNPGGLPVTVTAGRQNIMYGEGFIFMDGGPLDGSRTGYFNALRVRIGNDRRAVELHALSNPYKEKYLPLGNSLEKPLIEVNERGAGLYYTDNSFSRVKLEAYYIYKYAENDDVEAVNGYVQTIGTRFVASAREGLSLNGEGAVQFGESFAGRDRRAFGGYLYGTYARDNRYKPKVSAGVLYLSGDDPGTDDHEGWDPLYGRWPKWSELYIYTLLHDGGIAFWTNMIAPYMKVTVTPNERVTVIMSLYAMRAARGVQGYVVPLNGSPIAGGRDRGILSIVNLKWKLNRHLSGHLLWERFDPGDYYGSLNRDPAHFLRWELFFSY